MWVSRPRSSVPSRGPRRPHYDAHHALCFQLVPILYRLPRPFLPFFLFFPQKPVEEQRSGSGAERSLPVDVLGKKNRSDSRGRFGKVKGPKRLTGLWGESRVLVLLFLVGIWAPLLGLSNTYRSLGLTTTAR